MDASTHTEVGSTAILNAVIPLFWRVGSIVAGLAAIAAGLLYVKQDSLLYFPAIGGLPRRPRDNPRRYRSPAEYNIAFEDHRIPCDDGVFIHSWLLFHPDANAEDTPTLVFFHGNAGNIGVRLPNAAAMIRYVKVNVLMVEYRGYGDSDSVAPTEPGLRLDAEAALRFITQHPKINPNKVFLFGRSLGGAVAFHLAHYAERKGIPLAGVLVENTFLSVSEMVDYLMPMVAPLKGLVLRIGWDNSVLVPHLKTPVLYIAGEEDTLVPHVHMLQLYKATTSSRLSRLHVVPGGTHNETWMQGGREYWDKMKSFIAAAMASSEFSAHDSMRSVDLNDPLPDDVTRDRTAVRMGTESHPPASSIPTMPNGFLGMAREAASSKSSSGQTGTKKKD